LTKTFYENIIIPMRISKNNVWERDNLVLVYSGLNSISDKGREQLKNIAKSLVAIQNRPGTPMPDSISREIISNQMNELL
jgi:hypothetical protein